eukprot:gene23256-26324_t
MGKSFKDIVSHFAPWRAWVIVAMFAVCFELSSAETNHSASFRQSHPHETTTTSTLPYGASSPSRTDQRMKLAAAVLVTNEKRYYFNGGYYTFVTPPDVDWLNVLVIGARGGYGSVSELGLSGLGYAMDTAIPVVTDQELYIFVGGIGTVATGGYNGGGAPLPANGAYYGGGGASDVRTSLTPLTTTDSRLVVGGGGGGSRPLDCNSLGGKGGYPSGKKAWDGFCPGVPQVAGAGGTASAGGYANHTSCVAANSGSKGVGGNGCSAGGGGGGGGYYGGAGGYLAGGGGGSSFYKAPAVLSQALQSPEASGLGRVNVMFGKAYPDNSIVYTYSDAAKTRDYTVPAGVHSILVELFGAWGGCWSEGGGGRIAATLPVTPGEVLRFYLGGEGGGAGHPSGKAAPTCTTSGGFSGMPGTQTGGGAAGASGLCSGFAAAGTLGTGGEGCGGYYGAGVGGGGGYYGGGSGHLAGGGGGSSYSSVTEFTHTSDDNFGNGYAVFSVIYDPTANPTEAPTRSPTATPTSA